MRAIVVLGFFLYGLYQSLRSPFHALLLYLWVAHFRPHDWAWGAWADAIPMSMIAAGVVLVYTAIAHRRYTLNGLQGFMLLFCLLGAISTWQSASFAYSWYWYQGFLKVVLISYVLSVLVNDLHKFRWACLIICLSLGGEAAKQGLVGLAISPGAHNNNPILPLGDNNGVGLGMLILLSILIGLWHTAGRRWERWFLAVVGLGVLVRAVTTYSRGAFLTLAVLLILVWLQSNHKFRGALVIGVLVALVGAAMPQDYYNRMATITQVIQEEGIREASAASRLHLWEVAMQMANDHPITGVGFNAYSESYGWYDFLDGAYGERKEAHGSLPGVFADTGYIGGTVYLLMLMTAFHYMARIRRQSFYLKDGATLHRYATAMQNALVCFMVGGAFLSFMYYEIVWHLLGLCAALMLITRRLAAEQAQEVESTELPSLFNLGGSPTNLGGSPTYARILGR